MFDLFKKDIKIGDKVKLLLTTGKEPEGVVMEIGDNYVLLQTGRNVQNRIFDKLIGGWDVLQASKQSLPEISQFQEHETPNTLVNKAYLLSKAALLFSSLDIGLRSKIIEPNANILEVRGITCVALLDSGVKIHFNNNRIVDNSLKSEIEMFSQGTIIPVVISTYEKLGKNIVSAVALTKSIEDFINDFVHSIEQENFQRASGLLDIIRKQLDPNIHIKDIINEIKKTNRNILTSEPDNITVKNSSTSKVKPVFKHVEKEINDLIRQSKFEFALNQIEKELNNKEIEDKYKSSLLLKKAQIFSSINKPEESEIAYEDLIKFNEKIKSTPNNLSHLYTELARLQSLNSEKLELAISSVRKALKYNQNNSYASNLLKQIEAKAIDSKDNDTSTDEYFIVDIDEDTNAISKMIGIDIKEHKFTNPEIIKNGGKPTAFIAKSIFDKAKANSDNDLSEKYPIYLEAAKAFSELNVGSYDLQDYQESIAFYSMLKGNSLFINFKNDILNGDIDTIRLTRLSDSACSYYIEALNLLSNINPKLLLLILANYLKLNIVIFHVKNKLITDFDFLFKGQFADAFTFCLSNKNQEIEKMAYKIIIDCGASSITAWNQLFKLPKGTSVLYREFLNDKRAKEIFTLINTIEDVNININLKPGEFLRSMFLERRKKAQLLNTLSSNLSNLPLEPHNISSIINLWKTVNMYHNILTSTDTETKVEVDNILLLLEPYLNRNQSERTNILIQTRSLIERQTKFINENTTFYGRTFFYNLLSKWKREIDIMLEEKIAQSYPSLQVMIDPPYYIETNSKVTAPLIIKNEGEATSEGFRLTVKYESVNYEDSTIIPFESKFEIAAGSKYELSLVIPVNLLDETYAIEISIDIEAVYQNKFLTSKNFQFTLEKEPESTLTYEEIPWRDGPIPPEHLFKGRKKLIADLAQHYLSTEKDKPYILYGLTRTGKSSVLEYLRKYLEGDSFISGGLEKFIITFSWDFSVAASHLNAADFYNYILYEQTYEVMEQYFKKSRSELLELKIDERVRFKDFKIILEYLSKKSFYPIFFVDEFSFVKTLIDKGTINSAFLHSLRQFALNGLASFIFSGTYDIKALIRNPTYGITGQLVNAIEYQINEISNESSEELIDVIKDKLAFTPEAVEHIKFLSGNIPYFIQIICKYSGYYACENKRRIIGYPELEKVIRILIGQDPSSSNSLVKKLPENVFQNNQFSPADPKEVPVLISSITNFNKNELIPRGVGFHELEKLWADQKLNSYKSKLADAINLLDERKIIIKEEDEGLPVYKLAVDLFRRWWSVHYNDIDLILTSLTQD